MCVLRAYRGLLVAPSPRYGDASRSFRSFRSRCLSYAKLEDVLLFGQKALRNRTRDIMTGDGAKGHVLFLKLDCFNVDCERRM